MDRARIGGFRIPKLARLVDLLPSEPDVIQGCRRSVLISDTAGMPRLSGDLPALLRGVILVGQASRRPRFTESAPSSTAQAGPPPRSGTPQRKPAPSRSGPPLPAAPALPGA